MRCGGLDDAVADGFQTEYLECFKRHPFIEDVRIRSRKDKKSLTPKLPTRPLNASISREDYIKHSIAPATSWKPISAPIPFRPTQEATTYASNFIPWEHAEVKRCPAALRRNGGTTCAFDGAASYAVAFKGQPCELRLSAKPPNRPLPSQPFDASTTHRRDYCHHSIEQPSRPKAPKIESKGIRIQECSSYGYDFM